MTSISSPAAQRPKENIPGPHGKFRTAISFQRSPLPFLAHAVQTYGDVVAVDIPKLPFVVVNHPDHVDHILKRHHRNYDRHGPSFDMARNFFGNGLATAARPGWLSQRRLLQPAFHRKHITTFGQIMTSTIAETLERWGTVCARNDTLDLRAEMSNLTLRIVVRALFGMNPPDTVIRRFTTSVETSTEELATYMRFPLIPLSVPTPGHRRFHRAMATLDEIVYDMIARQRREDGDNTSLLSLMIQARDADTGEAMSDTQLHDEVLTMLFAGHETSATTLCWAWYLLGRHPETEQRLTEEVDRVLGGRHPDISDTTQLACIRRVVLETLRLYPPAWQLLRRAETDDEISGYHISAGTLVFWSYYLIHRHRDFWDQPEQFNPDRFTDQDGIIGDKPGFYPFGAGPRLCIGNTFAMAEMQLAMAMILQRFRMTPTDTTEIPPKASLTLQPAKPYTVRLSPRENTP
ncbi:cytochrome P450 [Nocardia brevicatena]|uniref:cytochrome P450 n=1 Tax=Nocardia brevicatena TaxID=37327 RepID=UPI00030EDB70|nr:cytochrome P450 [Nocardia brevicatena]